VTAVASRQPDSIGNEAVAFSGCNFMVDVRNKSLHRSTTDLRLTIGFDAGPLTSMTYRPEPQQPYLIEFEMNDLSVVDVGPFSGHESPNEVRNMILEQLTVSSLVIEKESETDDVTVSFDACQSQVFGVTVRASGSGTLPIITQNIAQDCSGQALRISISSNQVQHLSLDQIWTAQCSDDGGCMSAVNVSRLEENIRRAVSLATELPAWQVTVVLSMQGGVSRSLDSL